MTEQLRCKCLILDHDDTAVDSTASIHYPAYLEIMRRLRPDMEPESLEGWFLKNYTPGVMEYYKNELKFSSEEMQLEYSIWREFTLSGNPQFYDGFIAFLPDFTRRGGVIAVVSHSDTDVIQKHYHLNLIASLIEPELVFGWSSDEKKRKPSPYPVQTILEMLDLEKEDALIVDDLMPGVKMGRGAGVPVAAAGWGHQIPEIQQDMQQSCDHYFATVEELREFVILK